MLSILRTRVSFNVIRRLSLTSKVNKVDPPKLTFDRPELTPTQYVQYRRDLLSKHLDELYPNKVDDISIQINQFLSQYANLSKEDSSDVKVVVAGRVTSIRKAGKKLFFIDVERDGRLQIVAKEQQFQSDETWNLLSLLRRGDLISASGNAIRTPSGELSLSASNFRILAPALRRSTSAKVVLEDINKRYRRRYIDFLANPEKKDIFQVRAKIIREIRNHLESECFLEVETPMLADRFGGALARPFKTFHNQMDMELYLRIAPELYLKKLIIGGFDRVFEIGKQFRNEGVDRTHNPEFTTCECYMAYANRDNMMQITEKIIKNIVDKVYGEGMEKVPYQNMSLDFQSKFAHLDFLSSLRESLKVDLPSPREIHFGGEEVNRYLQELCRANDVVTEEGMDSAKILDKLFSRLVEPTLHHPTFVLNHPRGLSPLAKPHPEEQFLAHRFELVIAGFEVANAYSELNDPELQEKLFEDQNTGFVDRDYVKAMEYGLPPTGGLGIGIDRLTMILTNQRTIKEVLLFPMMKPIVQQTPEDLKEG